MEKEHLFKSEMFPVVEVLAEVCSKVSVSKIRPYTNLRKLSQ